MEFIGRAKALLATLREDNRGLVNKLEDVVDELRDIAPKLEAEFKELESAGVFRGLRITVDPTDNLPFPNSILADYERARGELAKLLGAPDTAKPTDLSAEVPADDAPAPDAPADAPAPDAK